MKSIGTVTEIIQTPIQKIQVIRIDGCDYPEYCYSSLKGFNKSLRVGDRVQVTFKYSSLLSGIVGTNRAIRIKE